MSQVVGAGRSRCRRRERNASGSEGKRAFARDAVVCILGRMQADSWLNTQLLSLLRHCVVGGWDC